MNNQAYHHLLANLDFTNKAILDIGFGTGWVEEEYLRDASSILAIEKDEDEVARMQQRWGAISPKASFVAADITKYTLQPSSADIALFLDSF